jgi:hypothetical protein
MPKSQPRVIETVGFHAVSGASWWKQTIDFQQSKLSRSSLSHWMMVRSAIAAFSTGTRVHDGASETTKPPERAVAPTRDDALRPRWKGGEVLQPMQPAKDLHPDPLDDIPGTLGISKHPPRICG